MALPRTPAQSYAAAVHVVQGRAPCLHPLLRLLCRICASYASLERTLPVWVAAQCLQVQVGTCVAG